MDNINELKAQLDNYYHNEDTFNGEKIKAVTKIIIDITLSKNGTPYDVATELKRFPANISKEFFESITKDKLSLGVIEDVLKELLVIDTNSKFSECYVSKYTYAIILIIGCYKEEAFQSQILPQLVASIANFAVKSEKEKKKFRKLINNSNGEIFKLDYSSISKSSLESIWSIINNIYSDLSKSSYEFIATWEKILVYTRK